MRHGFQSFLDKGWLDQNFLALVRKHTLTDPFARCLLYVACMRFEKLLESGVVDDLQLCYSASGFFLSHEVEEMFSNSSAFLQDTGFLRSSTRFCTVLQRLRAAWGMSERNRTVLRRVGAGGLRGRCCRGLRDRCLLLWLGLGLRLALVGESMRVRFFFVGSWGSQLLCKPFFRFFIDQKKTRKPRTFSSGGGGGVGGRRIKLYTYILIILNTIVI